MSDSSQNSCEKYCHGILNNEKSCGDKGTIFLGNEWFCERHKGQYQPRVRLRSQTINAIPGNVIVTQEYIDDEDNIHTATHSISSSGSLSSDITEASEMSERTRKKRDEALVIQREKVKKAEARFALRQTSRLPDSSGSDTDTDDYLVYSDDDEESKKNRREFKIEQKKVKREFEKKQEENRKKREETRKLQEEETKKASEHNSHKEERFLYEYCKDVPQITNTQRKKEQLDRDILLMMWNLEDENHLIYIMKSQTLYDKYIEYCNNHNKAPLKRESFNDKLKTLLGESSYVPYEKKLSATSTKKIVCFIAKKETIDSFKDI